MTHNKDKGTSVGFSNLSKEDWNDIANGREHPDLIKNVFANTVCKEHEPITVCAKCGAQYHGSMSIDFCIKENLKVISDNEWEDIENEFYKFTNSWKINQSFHEYKKWLKENFSPPEKKKS